MILPIVWLPEAEAELQQARAWYDDISHELGERFARAIETAVEAIAEHPFCNFLSCIAGGDVQVFGAFPMESSSRLKSIGLW